MADSPEKPQSAGKGGFLHPAAPITGVMERHEIRPAAWRFVLFVLGLMAFVALGVWLVTSGGIVAAAIGVLTLVFFGGFGTYALYRMSQGRGRIAILPSGVETTMFGRTPRVIPWSDIEAIGVLKLRDQEFTTIRLNRYRSLIDTLTDDEARLALREFQAMRLMSYATIAAGVAHAADVSDLATFVSGSEHVKSVVAMLRHARDTYGAEVLLPWNQRDRSARAFAEYLEQCRLTAAQTPAGSHSAPGRPSSECRVSPSGSSDASRRS